jgi:hypothetical protein
MKSRPRVGENSPIACLRTENPFSVKCGVMFKQKRDLFVLRARRANIYTVYLHETQVREWNWMG